MAADQLAVQLGPKQRGRAAAVEVAAAALRNDAADTSPPRAVDVLQLATFILTGRTDGS